MPPNNSINIENRFNFIPKDWIGKSMRLEMVKYTVNVVFQLLKLLTIYTYGIHLTPILNKHNLLTQY